MLAVRRRIRRTTPNRSPCLCAEPTTHDRGLVAPCEQGCDTEEPRAARVPQALVYRPHRATCRKRPQRRDKCHTCQYSQDAAKRLGHKTRQHITFRRVCEGGGHAARRAWYPESRRPRTGWKPKRLMGPETLRRRLERPRDHQQPTTDARCDGCVHETLPHRARG